MKFLMLLIPLAANAAASPCDPRCDPKAKAKASVVRCDPKPCTTVAGGKGVIVTATSPATTTLTTVQGDTRAIELRELQSLSELATSVRRARSDAATERAQALTTKEELIEAARGAYAAALKAQAMVPGIVAEAEAATRSSTRAWAEAEEAAQARGAYSAYVDPSVWGEVDDVDDVDDVDSDSDDQDLESRIRALERIARKQGHGTNGGSLEERVAALERTLAGSKSARAPLGTTPRAFYLDEDGRLHGFQRQDNPRLHARGLRGVSPAPAPQQRAPKVARVAPAPPAPAAPSAPAGPPAGILRRDRPDAHAPDAAPFWGPSQLDGDQRRQIENAMRELRSEADALRTELNRMREQVEALPRRNDQ